MKTVFVVVKQINQTVGHGSSEDRLVIEKSDRIAFEDIETAQLYVNSKESWEKPFYAILELKLNTYNSGE